MSGRGGGPKHASRGYFRNLNQSYDDEAARFILSSGAVNHKKMDNECVKRFYNSWIMIWLSQTTSGL